MTSKTQRPVKPTLMYILDLHRVRQTEKVWKGTPCVPRRGDQCCFRWEWSACFTPRSRANWWKRFRTRCVEAGGMTKSPSTDSSTPIRIGTDVKDDVVRA